MYRSILFLKPSIVQKLWEPEGYSQARLQQLNSGIDFGESDQSGSETTGTIK